MNFFNIIDNERKIKENCDLKKCYELCIKQNEKEFNNKLMYKIKEKEYFDFDDKKFFLYQIKCFEFCLQNTNNNI
jgi:hypothetical protein